MKDLAIAINVGSPLSTLELVKNTFESIKANVGNCDWKIFLFLSEKPSAEVKDYVRSVVRENQSRFEFLESDGNDIYWSDFINQAIKASSDYSYFIKSHDDIELQTPDFFNVVTRELDRINQEVGWISFTDTGWLDGDFSPSTRPGFHIDFLNEGSWQAQTIFQFHTFPPHWTRRNLLIDTAYRIFPKIGLRNIPYPKPVNKIRTYSPDMPKATVRCHAPFNHFVMIARESLDRIGPCENWNTFNALLVDEDWGLRALENNLPNIWMPNVRYKHFRGDARGGSTRSNPDISVNKERVGELFYQKWGFHSVPTKEEVAGLKQQYADNLVPWSSYRRSYEWDYV